MNLDFDKGDGLIPVIIQDADTSEVLMLGYMNKDAYEKTKSEKKVTFFSRSKKRLWTKGEESGNYLIVNEILLDCDKDTLLIKAIPRGPVCHTGTETCFGARSSKGFLYKLEKIINKRIADNTPNSYTNKIYREGINRVAQKVGEEAVELIIEAKDDNDQLFVGEAADLLYHLIILLHSKGVNIDDVEKELLSRHS